MRYWTRPVHLRYEAMKRIDNALLWLAAEVAGDMGRLRAA